MSVYLEFAKKKFLNKMVYRFDYIAGILNTVMTYVVFYCIYKALYGGAQAVSGITFSMVTTNFIISLCLSNVYSFDDEFIQRKIHDGSIANEFLKPVNFKGRILAENIGENCFRILFNFLPALLIASVFTRIEKPSSVLFLFLFIISTILGYLILWEMSFIVQTLAFWMYRVWGIGTIKDVIVSIFSGTMIPLWFMPGKVMNFIKLTPFDSIYFTPLKLYLGQITGNDVVLNFGRQLLWIGILFIIGDVLWKCGEKKVVVQGG
ncbi:MAG: ABC-2 family transporter protein [Bacillota bacterium]|nr:ABC-2 family transporter protein [Bacillota bacterium]